MGGAVTTDAPVFVLVHSPLVGPLTWSLVADELRRRGSTVVLPRLDNPDEPSMPFQRHHAERIRRSVEAEAPGAPVVLVGHSGAGAVLPVAGETLVNEVAGYVLVDADLPRDGVKWLDRAPPEFADQLRRLEEDGHLPPWAEWWSDDVLGALVPDDDLRERFADELRRLPVRLFEEPLRVPAMWPDAPCGYVRLSGGYDEAAAEAARRGWETIVFDARHLHMLVDPAAVASALLEISERLAGIREERADRLAAESVAEVDPIRAQRRRIARWVDLGRRVGFGAIALAIVLFAVALYWDLPAILVQLIVASLAVAAVTLLPALVLGYGIAAAEREDRERGHDQR